MNIQQIEEETHGRDYYAYVPGAGLVGSHDELMAITGGDTAADIEIEMKWREQMQNLEDLDRMEARGGPYYYFSDVELPF